MPFMCYGVENMGRIRPEIVQQRIKFFERRFGKAHLFLAHHAAFPLALTPDLLYSLWANFQLDINGKILNIPWIAVSDLLLSSLCHEVGHELYEMDLAVRNELLQQLKSDEKFGLYRINELSDFLLAYVKQQLYSDDPDIRDFAHTQRWTALAYTRPNKVAYELALVFSQLKESETLNIIRIASLTNTFSEPLAEFQPLLTYACAMEQFAHGNLESASSQLGSLLISKREICVEGVNLPIPKSIKENYRHNLKTIAIEIILNYLRLPANILEMLNVMSLQIFILVKQVFTRVKPPIVKPPIVKLPIIKSLWEMILFLILLFTTFVALSPQTFGGSNTPLVQVCKYVTSFGLGLTALNICSKYFSTSRELVKNWKSNAICITLIILSVTTFVVLSPSTFGGNDAPFVQICKYITSAGLAALGTYYLKNFNISRLFVNNWAISTFAITLFFTSFVSLSPETFGGDNTPFVQICKYITCAGLAALGIGSWSKRNI